MGKNDLHNTYQAVHDSQESQITFLESKAIIPKQLPVAVVRRCRVAIPQKKKL